MMHVYDCMLYNGEADLLELRLRETESAVFKWVIIESTHTHQGTLKSRFLRDDKERFAPWSERIVYELFPPSGQTPVERENRQREAIGAILFRIGVEPGDVVHISDLDEITSAETLNSYRPEWGLCSPIHRNSYYWLNCQAGSWGAAKLGTWETCCRLSGSNTHRLRFTPDNKNLPVIGNKGTNTFAGWHFSYMGGIEAIKTKLESFMHNDLNLPHFKAERHLRICRATGADLFLRADHRFDFKPVVYPYVPRIVEAGKFCHLTADAEFNERWINDRQLFHTCWTFDRVREMRGAVIELGSWEGASAVALANACYPDFLFCVDTWGGNNEDGSLNADVGRRVQENFTRNVKYLTRGNVYPFRMEHGEFMAAWPEVCGLKLPYVKFCHLDGNHQYEHVRAQLEWVLPLMDVGGVVCGDDFQTANAGRADLGGGVERAVRELCPGFEQLGNFWIWQKK